MALLIGNNDYDKQGRLSNTPRRDLKYLSKKFKELGYQVTVKYDLSGAELDFY